MTFRRKETQNANAEPEIKTDCSIIRCAAGRCSVCSEYVSEDLHVHGPAEEAAGKLSIFCEQDCPEHGIGARQ